MDLGKLVDAAESTPVALLAAVALWGYWHERREVRALNQRLYRLALGTRARDAAPNLGTMAQALAGVSAPAVARAAAQQATRPTDRIGALLVEAGDIERRDLERLVERQRALRLGARPSTREAKALADLALRKLPVKS